jgi:hypothetical protein
MLESAGVSGVAKDLARVGDPDRVCDGEAGVGGNQGIEIEHRTVTERQADVLTDLDEMVARVRKDRGTDDLAWGIIDSGSIDCNRQGGRSSGERAQSGRGPVAIRAPVSGCAVEVSRSDDLAGAIDGACASAGSAGRHAESDQLAVIVQERAERGAIADDLTRVVDRQGLCLITAPARSTSWPPE